MKPKDYKILEPAVPLATLGLAALLAQAASAQTITDNFTDPANWGTPFTEPAKNIFVASGRMNFTSTTTGAGGAAIARNTPILPITQDWSIKVDVHVDPFTITTPDQGVSVFLGVGKTGDWFNTSVILGFDRDWWYPDYYGVNDDVKINGLPAPGLFNVNYLPSPDATLRMDYSAANHTITFYCDSDGAANGYNWGMLGTADIASSTYDLHLSASDTFTIILAGWSDLQVVAAGQAYLSNLEITLNRAPDSLTGKAIMATATNGLPAVVMFDFEATTFIQTGSVNNETGDYTYTRTSPDSATIHMVWTAPPVVAGNDLDVSLVFTSPTNGTFTSTFSEPGGYSDTNSGTFQLSSSVSHSPVVTTGTGTAISYTSVTVNGTVNPNGLSTTAQFEYGLTTAYGSTTNVLLSPSNGSTAQAVSATLSGLQPGMTYYFRLTATNSGGAGIGSDSTFTVWPLPYTYMTNNGTITITGYTGWGGDEIIPSTINGLPVSSLGDMAFYQCSSLTGVTIPNGVTNIGASAFAMCTKLASVTMPNSVITIGSYAFYRCYSLPNVTRGDGVTDIGSGAFQRCVGLTNVTIGNSVTNIGSSAFVDCNQLTSVTIPNSVLSIGSEVFHGCTSLTNVKIGNSLTSIGPRVFYSCTSLTTIAVDPLNAIYSSLDGVLFNQSQTVLIQFPEGKNGPYAIPNTVTSIGAEAFYYCTSLTSITIPNNVISIESHAFFHCEGLTNVTLGNSVTSIGNSAFYSCTSLSSVTIPSSVTNISDYAFSYCTSLTNATLGNSVTSIALEAFSHCGNLTSVTIPNSATNIGDSAFYQCYSLTNVTIGNSVTSIGNSAFYSCTSLTNVTIPQSVTSIGNLVFYYCTSLTGVYFLGNAPSAGLNVFDYCNATVYYLPGTTGWGPTFGGRPTALWLLPSPLILTFGPSFGVQANAFGFLVSWATNTSVVVEAGTNLANPAWSPLRTNTLTAGWFYFTDPEWTNYPDRFYRVRLP